MSKLRLIGHDPNSFSRTRPSSRIPDPASSTMSSPSARTSTQVVLPPYRTVAGPGTGIEPRTPHSFSRVDDSDAADIGNRHRVCHATAPKPRVFAAPSQPLGDAQKKLPRNLFRGSLRETAIVVLSVLTTNQSRKSSCYAHADDWQQGR